MGFEEIPKIPNKKESNEQIEEKINRAIEIAVKYGGTDEIHHMRWVVDQMVRILAGDRYEQIVRETKAGDEGPDTYDWDVGVAP